MVDNIEACIPISTLLEELMASGFEIISSKTGDYHFNELFFLVRSNSTDADLININIDKIERRSPELFYCTCHWSLVEIKH